jgi:hypothetical protein
MRHTVSIEQIKDGLTAQIEAVVDRFAPPAGRHYRKGPYYYTLNPGRADRSVGSFVITMHGAEAGRWTDYASGQHGDLIDLIGLSLGLDATGAIKVAREFLGLDTESPDDRRRREEAAAQAKQRRAEEERARADKDKRKRKAAQGLWLSAEPVLIGTPVDLYLKARGIDLAALPHQPAALRYHSACRYYHEVEVTDPDTGEVTLQTRHSPHPAMLAAIARGKEIIDCHRTYLTINPATGLWSKPPVPDAKKVFADYTGGSIRLCGEREPRGGHLKLKDAPQGARVFVTEGIENALSLIMIRALLGQPPAFVVAAGSLWNLSNVELPAQIGRVVLAADNDGAEQARAMLDRAVAFHSKQGRAVQVWRSPVPGEDLNDALKRALQSEEERGAA